jgi:hypothetical protein
MGALIRALLIALTLVGGLAVTPAAAKPALPGEECQVKPHPKWSKNEQKVWKDICEGRESNLIGLPESERVLTSAFLETILVHKPWRETIPRQGVKIIGAIFKQEINLSGVKIDHEFWLYNCIFENNANFIDFKSSSLLIFSGSEFKAFLDLQRAKIDKNLFMRKTIINSANLAGAQIGGQLDMEGAKVSGQLNMDSASIGSQLFLREGEFGTIDLTRAEIGGNLHMQEATFNAEVDLSGAKIRGDLLFEMNNNKPTKWGADSLLDLRNLRVGALQAGSPEAWPKKDKLYLDGLTYERLGGLRIDDSKGMGHWSGSEYVEWLSRMKEFSPQPYEQAGKILKEMGRKDEAEEVLLAGRERLRAEQSGTQWWLSSFLYHLIGYGFDYWRALSWAGGTTLLGALLIFFSPSNKEDSPDWMMKPPPHRNYLLSRLLYSRFSLCLFYSFEMLIPLVKLRDAHTKDDPRGLVLYYFYFHRIFGWVLASFIAAGVAGLVK